MSLIGILGRGFGATQAPPSPPPATDALLLQVADAVTYAINMGVYSQTFTAVRYYQPRFELVDMDTLHVSVIPRSIAEKPATRALTAYDCSIDIGIQQRSAMDQATLDALTGLVAEIADRLRTVSLPTMPDARLVALNNEPVFAPDHLDELRQFTSVLSATYRVWR